MRVSTIKGDPGYVDMPPYFRATLDGVDVSEIAETADEELGEVVVIVKDDRGEFVFDGPDQLKKQVLRGRVVVTTRDE